MRLSTFLLTQSCVPFLLNHPLSDFGNPIVKELDFAGDVLRIRETNWFEHRMFNGPGSEINLHVFSSGCPEIDRKLMFRERLRSNAADRDLYARTKVALAQQEWKYVQNYADAKTVIEEIIARAGVYRKEPNQRANS